MRLVTFRQNDKTRIGIQTHEGIIDLSIAAPDLPTNMLSFLEAGTRAIHAAQSVENSNIHPRWMKSVYSALLLFHL